MQNVIEILKKVRRVEIAANRTVNELLAGQYKSVFRGQGMEFNEVREYESGDDVRLIDWNVTAREGKPYIKRFSEERELSIMFLIDISASGVFGTDRSKWDTILEITATLMFSALKNNDKVGLITFGDKIEKYFAPRKGKGYILRLIRELVACEPIKAASNIDSVLEYLSKVERRRNVVFLVSDFLVPGFDDSGEKKLFSRLRKGLIRTFYQGIDRDITAVYDRQGEKDLSRHRALSVCGRRHDLIALSIVDPHELEFPNVGFIQLQDAETDEVLELDTASRSVRTWIAQEFSQRQKLIATTLQNAGVDHLRVMTNEDTLTNLRRFFRMREKRFR